MPRMPDVFDWKNRLLTLHSTCPSCGAMVNFKIKPPIKLDGVMSYEELLARSDALAQENLLLRSLLAQGGAP